MSRIGMTARAVAGLVAALSLGGCGGMLRSSEEVVAAPMGTLVFETAQDWKAAAGVVDAAFKHCWTHRSGEFNQTVSEVRFDEVNARAFVELTTHGALGPQNLLTAEVRGTAAGTTVTTYHGIKAAWTYAEITKAWLVAGYRDCKLPKKKE